MGQLSLLIQGEFLRPVTSMTSGMGRPFKVQEIKARVRELLGKEED